MMSWVRVHARISHYKIVEHQIISLSPIGHIIVVPIREVFKCNINLPRIRVFTGFYLQTFLSQNKTEEQTNHRNHILKENFKSFNGKKERTATILMVVSSLINYDIIS
jgi:hypothetical protein